MKDFDYTLFYSRNKESGEYQAADGFGGLKLRRYKKGEYLALRGEPVRELSIVVEGEIIVEFVIESGLVIRSVNHRAPTSIGAIAILTKDGLYLADTIAKDDVVVLSFSREQIERRMQNSLDFMYNLISFIASRLEALSLHIAILTQKNIKAKLAYYLLMCSDGNFYKFNKKIGELAVFMSVERPSLSRSISQLVCDGIITYKNGRGEILNIRALKALTE